MTNSDFIYDGSYSGGSASRHERAMDEDPTPKDFDFECVEPGAERPPLSGLDIVRADYEGTSPGTGVVDSTERPANWFPVDPVFWQDVDPS